MRPVLAAICLFALCGERPASAQRDLPLQIEQAPPGYQRQARPVRIDPDELRRHGIRRLHGRHLSLYTDLPASPTVDELPAVFDKAFPQWCDYFGLDAAMHADWHVDGFLMKDKSRFERLGLMPAGRPPFRHGYAQGDRLWLYEQPSDYYRRHLLLHEGTHALMNMLLGSCGPPWYMEGTAELLATHRYADGRLELNFFPSDKSQTPMWGRVKLVKDAIAAGRQKTLEDVLNYGPTAHLQTEPYAWCWAAAAMLDGHPRYCSRFRRLYRHVRDADFNRRFHKIFAADWPDLVAQWLAFTAELDFGHDFTHEDLRLQPAGPLPPQGTTVELQANRGWQNTGVVLRAGRTYQLTASGRYQLADRTRIWWCEPGGITLRYHRGRPLGMLLGVVYPLDSRVAIDSAGKNAAKSEPVAGNPFLEPIAVGLQTTFSPREDGVLLLKINEPPDELHDNAGRLQLRIKPSGLTD